jgi:hypothetical protein
MPQGDKTGPRGQGPKTGRQMGNCEGAQPNYPGRGFGRGFCARRSFPVFGNFPELNKSQEKKILEADLAELEAEKAEIEKRLKTLKN